MLFVELNVEDNDLCSLIVTGIGIFLVKSTLFKFVFEIEDPAKIKYWLNEYFEIVLNFIWIVPFMCCIIFKGVVKGFYWFWIC